MATRAPGTTPPRGGTAQVDEKNHGSTRNKKNNSGWAKIKNSREAYWGRGGTQPPTTKIISFGWLRALRSS